MNTVHQNVDPEEIAKFERLASRWWDKEGEFKPLHEINPLRANYIASKAELSGKKLIDVGCGGGILCESMAQNDALVTGVDMGEAPLEVAKLHSLESGVEVCYEKSTAEDYAQAHPERFDVLTCMEMLEHVPDPKQTIAACADLVRPGGDLFFSTLNRTAKSWAFAIVGAEYILKLLPKGTHDHKKFIRPSELATWLRDANLELVDTCGLVYNPFTQHYSISQSDISVNYMMHVKKPLS
ncbi:MAG: bifunctional 3-demethylubiquinol 3-O-methyltransferase/2-polyprenyl-6-hydroxyphenol methylase [Alteromonadaceae bacterium]|nr:MAG: bifunctional 3-demethylubiquinol 3-O-methyltransferase/2-polyprenyl-6-hydroxyphenol methylase [Alteromonadaceae bacterium]